MRNSTPFFAAFAPLLFGRPPRSFRTALRQSVLKADSLSQWRAARLPILSLPIRRKDAAFP